MERTPIDMSFYAFDLFGPLFNVLYASSGVVTIKHASLV